ncbi:hypothetical protein Poli38472_004918 [Pythium oligandrum]|uniref:Uncharacterized protein n=1 Tax=Pythium oligandrum TaxID=41045 RepID=A0A8K1FGB8_PYTOL|nr:hypothetical protein Poli38472_004918 [Pythium oligandrum]|eukprot:TMW59849.1 hypothetical protein Poli38472_004918 [Pythium oligandrum]
MDWLEDLDLSEDPSTLFMALAVFDDESAEDDTNAESEPTPRATKIAKKGKGRTDRREEISFLRSEADVLTRRLELLRRRQRSSDCRRGWCWRALAAEQQFMRKTKELENAQLRELCGRM